MIRRIKIGTGSCGLAAGAAEVFDYFKENINECEVIGVGCVGHCYAEPLVEAETEKGSYFYQHAKPTRAFLDTVLNLADRDRLSIRPERQERELIKVTRLAGKIDPTSIDEFIRFGGYRSLDKALQMKPEDIVAEVKTSGLRGRGGGGFPTGLKWSLLQAKEAEEKVLICNADEGDPGAFMDRSLMESVPHQVLEGMLIAAHATGATQVFIYCRAEYPLAIKHLKVAIRQILDRQLNRIDSREITIRIKEGAGAFVCGEETAMIHSLEGSRGTPRFRPPYPTDAGYKGYPTLINNVETYANIPLIIDVGGAEFAKVGTENSKGTKLFALAGDLPYPGLVEVPMGITLGEVVYTIGGAQEGAIKAVQIGGPSGGCIPAEHIEAAGFEILAMKMVLLNKSTAADFYTIHKGKPFYEDLVQFMSSGRCVVAILEKENAVEDFRRLIGATDPKEAAKGTIRRKLAANKQENIIHASDSAENAEKEIAFFFSKWELL